MLDYGANIHFKKEYALERAIRRGMSYMANMVLENGANLWIDDGRLVELAKEKGIWYSINSGYRDRRI